MAAALAWETTRWRGAPNPPFYHQVTAPQRSASTGRHNSSDAHAADTDSNSRNHSHAAVSSKTPTDDESRYAHQLPALTDPYTDTSTYRSQLHERPTPPSDALMNAPPQPPAHHQARNVSSWPDPQRHHSGTVGNERHGAAATPLTLQIPKDQELPRISTMFNAPPSGHYYPDNKAGLHTPSHSSTMLPPFATFQTHAKRADGFNDVQRTPPTAPAPCNLCSKLQPMVAEVATAVAELDESIQVLSNKPIARSSEYPRENLFHAVQWILDRLRCGKVDMQAAIRAVQPGSGSQPTPTSGVASRNISPSMPLKRPAEVWEHEDSPVYKRPTSSRPFEEPYRIQSLSNNERMAPHPYHSKGPMRPAHITPPPMDSVPGSAYPKMPSPGHAMRSLPSPSSVAYPSSTAPSLAPPNARSPSTSHTAETSDAATSAHIADLQHQVTLKSLALQTLRSEYSSLLQRVQRLNVKTQTMERKSSVADHEVNELTNKNEDLTQQLQSLQEQLDDSERRREKEREESSREKDQWLQMLEQGRRLQAKVTQERKALSDRIAALQAENDQTRSERSSEFATTGGESIDADECDASASHSGAATSHSDDMAALRADIEMLRSSLEEAKSHRQQLDERAYEVLRRSTDIGNVIDRALGLQSPPGEEAQQTQKAVRDPPLDAPAISSPQPNAAPSPPEYALDSHTGKETLNLGSFRPLTTYVDPDATQDAHPPSHPVDASPNDSESTSIPLLSITVTGSPTKSQALTAAAASLPTPVTPLSAADQQSPYESAGTVSKPAAFEHAAAAAAVAATATTASTAMPPPPRPVV